MSDEKPESSSARQERDDKPESSSARQEPAARQERRWVALVSKPVILPAESDRARAMAERTTAELDLNDVPRLSNLVLHPRIVALGPNESASQPSAYILAADRYGGLLFRVTKPGGDDPADEDDITMYLCSARVRKAIPLPAAPYSGLGVDAQPRRSVGLIGVPAHPGAHYWVAQLCPRPPDDKPQCITAAPIEGFLKPLHNLLRKAQLCLRPPSSAFRGDNLLCFSTLTGGWFLKPLHTTTAVRKRNLCGETGVLAHAGRLYWLALAYGIFFCDPFARISHLRFVPLPDDCQVWEEEERTVNNRANVALRRRVAPSEGHLRYVEISGLSYDVDPAEPLRPPANPIVRMWTLVDPEAAEPWRFEKELEAPFDVVWKHESYVCRRLPFMSVPHVAFVDPDNHRVVYFLQHLAAHEDSKLYGVDLQTRQLVSCEDCPPVRDDREIMLRNSRPIIDAWERRAVSLADLNNGDRDRCVIEHVDSWLERM